jgi:hypothetical protein
MPQGRSSRLDRMNKAAHEMAARAGALMIGAQRIVEAQAEEGFLITGFSVRLPRTEDQDVLVVVRAITAEGPVVGFHGSLDLGEAIVGMIGRLQANTMKWKDDEYALKERG